MMTPDPAPGLMGYWRHDTDPVALTLLEDRRRLEQMEDAEPARFVSLSDSQVNASVLSRLDAIQEQHGFGNGSRILFYLEELAFGSIFSWKAQKIGSCVASGAMRALTDRMIWEIVVEGDPEEFLGRALTGRQNIAPFAPYHYGWGRKHSGIGGYSDGSMCGGQIEALMTNGWLPCDTPALESDDFPEPQNTRTYKDWGAHKHIREFEPHGKVFDLTESERIQDTDRLLDVLKDGKPCMICSGWGFGPQSKHAEGFTIYKRSGSWAHNMTVIGFIVTANGDVFVVIRNSWGMNAHKDGDWFAVPISLMGSWLRSAECRTIGQLKQRQTTPTFW